MYINNEFERHCLNLELESDFTNNSLVNGNHQSFYEETYLDMSLLNEENFLLKNENEDFKKNIRFVESSFKSKLNDKDKIIEEIQMKLDLSEEKLTFHENELREKNHETERYYEVKFIFKAYLL